MTHNSKFKILAKTWVVPFVIALIVFTVARPAFAQIVEGQTNLTQYLATNNVEVGREVIDGFDQVYYVFEGQKTYVNKNNQNKTHPNSQGEYMVWSGEVNGTGQIYLYHIPTDTTVQITNSGNNLNPKVSREGKVVWEKWVDPGSEVGGTWQIYFFDGKSIAQLTSGDLSLNPEISGDYITFGRRDVSETWRAVLYSIKDKKTIDITVGEKARNPKIKDGKIYLAAGTSVEEEFPLTVDDLFLLNLVPLTATSSASPETSAPETVTTEEIIEEFNASPSASPASTGTP